MLNGNLQIKNNKYYVVYREPGNRKLKWKSTGISVGETKREQKNNHDLATIYKIDLLNQIEEELDRKSFIEMNVLFTDHIKSWLEHEKNYVKYSTYDGYKRMINGKIIPYFEDKGYVLSEITTDVVEKYLVYLKEHGSKKTGGGLKLKSIKNICSVLNATMESALINGLIDVNPVVKAKIPRFDKINNDDKLHVYTPEQVKLLLKQSDNEEAFIKIFIYLDAVTGARKGELLGLLWDDVDFDNKYIMIKRNRIATDKENIALLTTPKTKNSVRRIFLPDNIIDMLREEKCRQDLNRELLANKYAEYDDDFVIRRDNGVIPYPSSITRAVKNVMKKAGLPVLRVHDIRHTVASILFNDVSVKEVSVMLGHSNTRITEEIYIHRENICNIETTNALANQIGL